ncbi:MAG: hypothetical protein ABGX07_02560 [Pirellulaceae bacterium]
MCRMICLAIVVLVGGIAHPATVRAQESILDRILKSVSPFSWRRNQEPIEMPAVAGRPWGTKQATGPPNTAAAGDFQTAWASLSPDGQDEWLELTYQDTVLPKKVEIHETFNPGAVYKITVFDGKEEAVAWEGKDPTPANRQKAVSTIDLTTEVKTNRIRIYLKSKAIAGWNEIDAVGLVDAGGKRQWAEGATASSTFADQIGVAGQLFDVGEVAGAMVVRDLFFEELVEVEVEEQPDVGQIMKDQDKQMGRLVRELVAARAETKKLENQLEAIETELTRLRRLVENLQKDDRP